MKGKEVEVTFDNGVITEERDLPSLKPDDYFDTSGCKMAINDVLFRFLPPTVTIGKMNEISEKWFDDVYFQVWPESEKVNARRS